MLVGHFAIRLVRTVFSTNRHGLRNVSRFDRVTEIAVIGPAAEQSDRIFAGRPVHPISHGARRTCEQCEHGERGGTRVRARLSQLECVLLRFKAIGAGDP